jgi:hypothetical protein
MDIYPNSTRCRVGIGTRRKWDNRKKSIKTIYFLLE